MRTRQVVGTLLVFSLWISGGLPAGAAESQPSPGAGRPASRPIVLFDEAHEQRFRLGGAGALDLSRLGAAFTEAGAEVAAVSVALTPEALSRAEVLVVSGAFRPFSPAEIDAVTSFVERGGRLAVLLHIGPPAADLLHRLGVSISNGVVREESGVIGNDAMSFAVTHLARHPVNAGLTSYVLFGAWALLPTGPGVATIAESGPTAWVDLNRSGRFEAGDARQSFALVVAGARGEGRFVVFGDDALFQNKILEENADNRRLAGNQARWLVLRAPKAVLAERGEGRRTPVVAAR